VFERASKDFGLPKAIRTDNGVPFASAWALFGLSKLSVWWLRLGIRLERIKPGNPQQNGRHERMHLTLKKEAAKCDRDLCISGRVLSANILASIRHCARTPRRSTPALPCPEVPVESIQIKALRIEHTTDPAHHVFVLLVRSVGKNLEEQLIATRATDVFGRTGVFAGKTYRQRQIPSLRKAWQRLDHEPVLPSVTHVVAILELPGAAQLRNDGSD
jgi:transposase InsO family protein